MAATNSTIDEYIAQFPEETQQKLQEIRQMAKKAAPEAVETISYGVPTLKLNSTYLIYFAGYKDHISIYPIPKGTEKFNEEIAQYKAGKGTLQFQLSQPMPWKTIEKIVTYSLETNKERTKAKKKK